MRARARIVSDGTLAGSRFEVSLDEGETWAALPHVTLAAWRLDVAKGNAEASIVVRRLAVNVEANAVIEEL